MAELHGKTMKRKIIFLAVLSLVTLQGMAQEKPFHLKTNLPLWALSTPNLTLEYQLAPRQSLSVTGYKGEFVFISETAIQGINLSYRKYFNRQSEELKGLYLSPGLAYFAERYNNRFPPTYGVRTDIGLQHVFKSNIIIDVGAGLYWQFYEEPILEDQEAFKLQPLMRANFSLGYRF